MTDYISVAEVKTRLQKGPATTDDTLLKALVTAASRVVDRVCNQPDNFFVALTEATARTFGARGRAWVTIDECTSISGVAVKDSVTDDTYTAWTTDDYIPFSGDPDNPDFNSTPYNGLICHPNGDYAAFLDGKLGAIRVPTVQVTATWGYATAVPAQIKEAAGILAGRWFKRGQSSWSDTLASPDMGGLMYTMAMDPDFRLILERGRFIRQSF